MSPTPDKRDELRLLIHSRHPILAVETSEESRVEDLAAQVAAELDIPFFTWTVTKGLMRRGTDQPIYDTEDPDKALTNIGLMRGDAIFLLKDFARYLENDRILRRMRELAASFRDVRRSVIISAPVLRLPAELEDEAYAFRIELPDHVLLAKVVQAVLAEYGGRVKNDLDAEGVKQVARNLAGLTKDEARRTFTRCLMKRHRADAQLISDVLEAKRVLLQQEGVLDYITSEQSFADVAGLGNLKDWLRKRRHALTSEGKKFGLEPPKGILITGVQGCGKSLSAKAVAGEWQMQLARFDAGALYDKYIGESEKRLRRTLEIAEQLAPMVLWIDEIEKGFAATGSSADVDAGLSQRILASFLTWLQDRESGVFVVATSNDISRLPPELLRKGRFDEIFFVDLPGDAAREELFRIHLKRRGRTVEEFDLAALAAASEGFSGAEIEQAIVAAMYSAFEEKKHLTTRHLTDELGATRPLSRTRREDIDRLRQWARERAVPAD